MIIDLSFILFNIPQPSDYSISLLLLAKSSIPTSIRGDSSSAISVKFELYAFDAELQKKSFRYYLHRLFDGEKKRIVCWLQKMPQLSLQRQQNVLTAIATDQDLVYLQVVSGFLFEGVYLT